MFSKKFDPADMACTLNPEKVCDESDIQVGHFGKTHPDGWFISGHVKEDWYYWVNEFAAYHPTFGWVWGDYENEVHADSEEAFQAFYAAHPPEIWDYAEI